jgi:hypothetical protein
VSADNLKNLDSIIKYNPYTFNNGVNQISYTNLPQKLRENRDKHGTIYNKNAWDKITEKYKAESIVSIDTININTVAVKRNLTQYVYNDDIRVNKRLSIDEFKSLLLKNGITPQDYKILENREVEWSGGSKSTFLELRYKGTSNKITINRKGIIQITTYLESQMPYWESQGHQFSTTTPETIEKYTHKRGN